jgi:SAM-dependent methyltransferase
MIYDGQHLEYGIYAPSPVSSLEPFASAIRGKKLLDLGSGRGEIVAKALELGADAYGIEIEPELVTESQVKDRIICGNIFAHDLSKYEVLYYYLQGCKEEAELFRKVLREFRGNVIVYSG